MGWRLYPPLQMSWCWGVVGTADPLADAVLGLACAAGLGAVGAESVLENESLCPIGLAKAGSQTEPRKEGKHRDSNKAHQSYCKPWF